MNKLDELIKELCPNGVEFHLINDLIKNKVVKIISPSIKIKRKDFMTDGSLPIISQEQEYISGYTTISDDRIIKDEYICFGDHSEHIKYVNFKFVQGADGLKILSVRKKEKISPKYLYYAACNFYKRYNNYERHFKYFSQLMIPFPPLPVQEEIVRILDNFTELTAELTTELTARKKQYEYYRDALLTFNKNVEYIKISDTDLVNIKRGIRVVKGQLSDKNHIPVFQNSLTPLGFHDRYNVNSDTTFVIVAGAAGEIGFSDVNFWAADDCFYFETSKGYLNKFLYYVLMKNKLVLQSKVRKASIPRLSRIAIEQVQIPIISLKEQQRIVDILDRFDKLCNDISEGLPAEIEARQKQYEYYRDKLLTFKPLEEVK